jgi:xylulokinase
MGLVAGVDCSTQSTKVLVVDQDDGRLVAAGAASHPVEGTGGARETDPAEWEASLAEALDKTGRAAEVTAISIGGQQHGLVVLDEAGRPLRKAPLWNDTRGAADAARLVEEFGGPYECAKRVGSVLTSSFTVAHWAWLRRTEPDIAGAVRRVMLPHDYLTYRLSGGHFTDRSDVSGTGWWSPATESYDAGVLALPSVDLPEAYLPGVLGPEGSAGEVGPAASAQFGLARGTAVACGAGDNAAAALALSLQPGEAGVSLGTSGTVFAPGAAPSVDPTGTVAGFAGADGRYLPLACTLNATVAIDQISEWLGLGRDDVVPSGQVVFLPWLGGERTPNVPLATGAVAGMRYETDKRSVLQAAYEGLVATLLEATALLDGWAAQSREAPLLLIGGGARGRTWQETVRRLSGRPLLVVEAGELVAYGAAVQAAALASGKAVVDVARDWQVRRGTLFDPVPCDEATLARIAAWRTTVLPWFAGEG